MLTKIGRSRTLLGLLSALALILGLVVAQAAPASAAVAPTVTTFGVYDSGINVADVEVTATVDGTVTSTLTWKTTEWPYNQMGVTIPGFEKVFVAGWPQITVVVTGIPAGIYLVNYEVLQVNDFGGGFLNYSDHEVTVPADTPPPAPTMKLSRNGNCAVLLTYTGGVPPTVDWVYNDKRFEKVSAVEGPGSVMVTFVPLTRPKPKPTYGWVGAEARFPGTERSYKQRAKVQCRLAVP